MLDTRLVDLVKHHGHPASGRSWIVLVEDPASLPSPPRFCDSRENQEKNKEKSQHPQNDESHHTTRISTEHPNTRGEVASRANNFTAVLAQNWHVYGSIALRVLVRIQQSPPMAAAYSGRHCNTWASLPDGVMSPKVGRGLAVSRVFE